MENKNVDNLLTSILRFVALLLFAAGVIFGIGIHFILDFFGNGIFAEAVFGGLVCAGLAIAFIWAKIIDHNSMTAFARLVTLFLFVAGILGGVGASILVGTLGSWMIGLLLFSIVVIWGLWIFRKKEDKK